MDFRLIFIRHGKTAGNENKKYIGITNEPLSQNGIKEIKDRLYPKADRVISSPMLRCRQTAELIYGNNYEVYDNLHECNFGMFEDKSFEELKDEPDYTKWIESGGMIPPPDGEGKEEFAERCCVCFENIVKPNSADNVAFVVHGGTIMAILERYCGGSFYDYQLGNGEYIVCNCSITDGECRLAII